MATEQLVVLTRAKVARLADVSERRLDYWRKTGLLQMTIDQALSPSRRVRLMGYQDAMTAMVLASLREQVSLQHVRQIVAHLRDLEFSVTEVQFAIVGKQVHFQLPDGSWSGISDPGQIVIPEVLNLEPLRAAVLGAGRRASADAGKIERRRGALGSKPVLSGTRIPVRAIQAFLAQGVSTSEIIEAYPSLTPDDIEKVRTLASA